MPNLLLKMETTLSLSSHRQDATQEMELLMKDVEKFKDQKITLMANIKSTAIEHLNKFKAGAPNGGSGNAD